MVEKYAGADDNLTLQLLTYAGRARCVRECKAASLAPNQRYPDPVILNRFRTREAYAYLHFAYYKVRVGWREVRESWEGYKSRKCAFRMQLESCMNKSVLCFKLSLFYALPLSVCCF